MNSNWSLRYSIEIECGTELIGFEQDEQGVTAHLVKHGADKDTEETVRIDYLIGADGARSKLDRYVCRIN